MRRLISRKRNWKTISLSKNLDGYIASLGSLNNFNNLNRYNAAANNNLSGYQTISLDLIADSYWMFGGGDDNNVNKAQSAPLKEEVIEWNTNNIGNIHKYNLVIPASSIKGALSHRIAYHYNLLQQKWADTGDAKAGEENEAVKASFGYCKNNNQSDGARGKVIINDIFIPDEEFNQKLINHFRTTYSAQFPPAWILGNCSISPYSFSRFKKRTIIEWFSGGICLAEETSFS